MEEILKYVLAALLGALGPGVLIAYLIFVNQSAVEKWLSFFWRVVVRLAPALHFAHKQYLKYDLQGRINSFTRRIRADAPFLATEAVKVEFVSPLMSREAFLRDGRVVLRLRRDDPNEANFVHGAYLFVSTGLLHKVKNYISRSHREALDLYVTTKLLEREKAHLVSIFLNEYLHPQTGDPDSKVNKLFNTFEKTHRAGLFFPVLLQELFFLGEKVFGRRRDDQIIIEVNDFLTFLENVAGRRLGEEIELNFERGYCRVGVVIIGKYLKISPRGEAWVEYIRRELIPKKIETVYLIGPAENEAVMESVAAAVGGTFERLRTKRYRAQIVSRAGDVVEDELYLIVLRLRGVTVFQPAATAT